MDRTHSEQNQKSGSAALFSGFALPTSNATYTPNQFFDVCLRHQSRGVVRLVGYMIRKTLGWCDQHGNPLNETISVSYSELERNAGVGHTMIRESLDQAQQAGFINCVREGQASNRSNSGVSAAFELSWSESREYIKDPKQFHGFFAGEGNRTYIPNQFFDQLLPSEPLAMIQVVGAIIRFSIGFQNKYGHRRQRVALSYRDIQRYAKIKSPTVLSKTIREAIRKNYIERVEAGFFDPNGGALSRSAHYALKWAQGSPGSLTTPKSVAAKIEGEDHTENLSGTTPKSVAANHSEKRSGIQIKQINKTSKTTVAAVGTFERLKAQGFDERAAKAIADRYPAARIQRQIDWLDQRRIKANRLGMLRTAIDQDWTDPNPKPKLGRPNFSRSSGMSYSDAMEDARRRLLDPLKSKTKSS